MIWQWRRECSTNFGLGFGELAKVKPICFSLKSQKCPETVLEVHCQKTLRKSTQIVSGKITTFKEDSCYLGIWLLVQNPLYEGVMPIRLFAVVADRPTGPPKAAHSLRRVRVRTFSAQLLCKKSAHL